MYTGLFQFITSLYLWHDYLFKFCTFWEFFLHNEYVVSMHTLPSILGKSITCSRRHHSHYLLNCVWQTLPHIDTRPYKVMGKRQALNNDIKLMVACQVFKLKELTIMEPPKACVLQIHKQNFIFGNIS